MPQEPSPVICCRRDRPRHSTKPMDASGSLARGSVRALPPQEKTTRYRALHGRDVTPHPHTARDKNPRRVHLHFDVAPSSVRLEHLIPNPEVLLVEELLAIHGGWGLPTQLACGYMPGGRARRCQERRAHPGRGTRRNDLTQSQFTALTEISRSGSEPRWSPARARTHHRVRCHCEVRLLRGRGRGARLRPLYEPLALDDPPPLRPPLWSSWPLCEGRQAGTGGPLSSSH
jgi:hypothetical protein